MDRSSDRNPFDPMALFDETRKRFGLGEEDVARAMAGLMPAFWAGVRHSAASGNAPENFFAAFLPPGFAPQAGGIPSGFGGGFPAAFPGTPEFLERIFPNEAIRKAVLDQVSQSTGVARDALAEMLPVAATLMMGAAARRFAVGPAREWLDAFMAGYARGRPKPPPSAAEMMAPFTEAMGMFFEGFAQAGRQFAWMSGLDRDDEGGGSNSGPARAPRRRAAEPVDEAPEEAKPPVPDAEEGEAEEGDTEERNSGDRAEPSSPMHDFLAAGREIQESQVRAFEQMFETLVPRKS